MGITDYRTIILGAGAAGLHCAAFAAKAGPVLVVEHAKSPGEKIRISGGGRCNFTNLHTSPENFLSANPHFAKSALARYSQWDFIDLVARHRIAYHEKTLGQLFCDGSAKQIIQMLLAEMLPAELRLQTAATNVQKTDGGFALTLSPCRTAARSAAATWSSLPVANQSRKSVPVVLAIRLRSNSVTPSPRLAPGWCR